MTTFRQFGTAVLVAGVIACAGGREANDAPAPPAEEPPEAAVVPDSTPVELPVVNPAGQTVSDAGTPPVTGQVGSIGVPPADVLVLRPAGGDPVRVDGDLGAELRRLTGATVAVYGPVVEGAPWHTVTAERYDVLAVDGRQPVVGTIRLSGDTVWLDAAESWTLLGVPDGLRQPGAKVYVIGERAAGALQVQSFGIIRAAPEH